MISAEQLDALDELLLQAEAGRRRVHVQHLPDALDVLAALELADVAGELRRRRAAGHHRRRHRRLAALAQLRDVIHFGLLLVLDHVHFHVHGLDDVQPGDGLAVLLRRELGVERGAWTLELRPWLRIREAAEDDDNPDVEDFVGRGELRIARHGGDHGLVLQLRHSLRGGDRSRGSAQLEWAFPLSGALHGYLQVFSGYGESLVDYNLRQTKLGLGVAIAGWQ